MKTVLAFVSVVLFFAGLAEAGDLTAEEKSMMEKAIAEKGCEGGKFFRRGDTFIVDDTECKEGEFEITLDKDFTIIKMEEE